MLHTETVSPATLELLKHLMNDSRLQDFALVGGTALALQMGHRISVDLDLFSPDCFDEMELSAYLAEHYSLELVACIMWKKVFVWQVLQISVP